MLQGRRAPPVLFLGVVDRSADDRDTDQSAQRQRQIAIGSAGRSGCQTGDSDRCRKDEGYEFASHFVDLSYFLKCATMLGRSATRTQ